MLQHLLHGLGRLRRGALSSGVLAFAVAQVLSPLLHTHVSATAAASQSGIHLPVALVHDGHGHAGVSASEGTLLDEANAITAPPEHRRDGHTLLSGTIALATGHSTPSAPFVVSLPGCTGFAAASCETCCPPPPSRGPPAIA